MNNGQHKDLVTSSEQGVEIFLADSEGRFPGAPSYSVDLQELQQGVGKVDFDNVDYSNLSGVLAHTYDFHWKMWMGTRSTTC